MQMNERKKNILNAAHRIFVEKGFQRASIQDILEEADISKGTFYNYFSSKNECLIAILERIHEESDQKRIELAFGKSKQDEEVFIQQIAVRLNMNKDQNVIALFNAVMHSENPNIKAYLDKQYRHEIQWVSNRLMEIYSPQTTNNFLDYAVMFLGMVHHFLHVWKMGSKDEIDMEKVIRFILEHMKVIIREKAKTGGTFFAADWLEQHKRDYSIEELPNYIEEKINRLIEKVDPTYVDYFCFLRDEITTKNPRVFLIESILLSLTHLFVKTEYEFEVRDIIQLVEKYIGLMKLEEEGYGL